MKTTINSIAVALAAASSISISAQDTLMVKDLRLVAVPPIIESGKLLQDAAESKIYGIAAAVGLGALGMAIASNANGQEQREAGYSVAALGIAVGFTLNIHGLFLERKAGIQLQQSSAY